MSDQDAAARLAAIRVREADPDLFKRAGRVTAAIVRRIDSVRTNKLLAQAKAAASPRAKVILLREVADEVVKAAAGIAPCARGCDHCCHMATLVTVEEAAVIARATGAKLAEPAHINDFSANMQARHTGVPCTFLTATGCAIYAQRPLACRVHVSVDSDATLCEIVPGERIRALWLNTAEYDKAFVDTLGGAVNMRYADVREFFPQGLKR